MEHLHYPIATLGTLLAIALGFAAERIGAAIFASRYKNTQDRHAAISNLRAAVFVICGLAITVLWFRLFKDKSTTFGLIGAGLAVALREPLLSIAGRLSIWLGRMYRVGDRIEFENMAGDVISIGVFYTRMLEVGNWIHGDQATGRIVQFPNSNVYQHSIYNYTQDFSYIWDEIELPITYSSDVQAASDILTKTGQEYTQEFLQGAQAEIAKLQESSLLPDLNFEPTVFTKVTSNYIELRLRYLVDPRKRRAVSSRLYRRMFELVHENDRIDMGSDTMDLTVHPPERKTEQEG